MNKRYSLVCTLLTGLMVLIFTKAIVFSEQLPSAYPAVCPFENVYVVKNNVPVRSEANTNSEVQFYANKGEQYITIDAGPFEHINGVDERWYEIVDRDHIVSGWIYGDAIAFRCTEQGISEHQISNIRKYVVPSADKIEFSWSRKGDKICFVSNDIARNAETKIQLLYLESDKVQEVAVVPGYPQDIRSIDDQKWNLVTCGDKSWTLFEIALTSSGKYNVSKIRNFDAEGELEAEPPHSEDERACLQILYPGKYDSAKWKNWFRCYKDNNSFYAHYLRDNIIKRLDIDTGTTRELTLTSNNIGDNLYFSKIGKYLTASYPVGAVGLIKSYSGGAQIFDLIGDDVKRLFQIYGRPKIINRSNENALYVYSVNPGPVQLYDLKISSNIEFKRIVTDKWIDIELHGEKVAFTKMEKGSIVLCVGDIVQ